MGWSAESPWEGSATGLIEWARHLRGTGDEAMKVGGYLIRTVDSILEVWDGDAAEAFAVSARPAQRQIGRFDETCAALANAALVHANEFESLAIESKHWGDARDSAAKEIEMRRGVIAGHDVQLGVVSNAVVNAVGDALTGGAATARREALEQERAAEQSRLEAAETKHTAAVSRVADFAAQRKASESTFANAVSTLLTSAAAPAAKAAAAAVSSKVKKADVQAIADAIRDGLLPEDWDAWAKENGYSNAEIEAAIASLSDEDLDKINARTGPAWMTEGDVMNLCSWLLAHASAKDVKRLHDRVEACEPGIDDGTSWGDEPADIDVDGGFSRDDIRQGQANDCWYLAALAAMAGTDPELLERNIKQNENGTYSVTLYQNGKPVTVTVTGYIPEDDTTGSYRYATDPYGKPNWVSIYEKALAQLPQNGSYGDLSGGRSIYDGRYTGEGGLETISGKNADVYQEVPLDELEKALEDGRPITVTTWVSGRDDMVDWHVYTVEKIVDGKVYLHNPWGNDNGDKSEIVVLSYQEFLDATQFISVGDE